jgi:hypothetical protein
MWLRVDIVLTDVSEERIASIFKVKEKRKSASEEPACGGGCSLQAPEFLYLEDGGDTFLRIVCSHKIYTAPDPRRRHSSWSPP